MKHILAPILLLVFLFPALAMGEEYLNEEQIENTWVVNVNEQRDEVNVSVNGEVVHGDRLRIRILKDRCDVGNTIVTFLTYEKNPEILNLKDVLTSAVFKDTDIKVRILFALKFVSLGYFVTLDLGWNKIDDIKWFFSGETRVFLTLKDDENFKPSEYFDLMQNSWSLNGLENALDRARKACLKLP